MSFDVSTEKWIPFVTSDGMADEAGMRDVLANAHLIRAIVEPMPTVEFGLHRLLVAFVLDIFGAELEDLQAWGDLWKAKKFDAARLDAYFAKHGDAFDLFDAQRPFLQSPGMEGDEAKPLAGLLPSIPSGTAASHFHHGDENTFGVSPKMAARLLTTIAPWMTAGGAGLNPSINGAPPFYVLPLGENLFQTLLLNTLVLREGGLCHAQGEEIPAWRDEAAVTATRATKASLLAALSWRPRRIQLIKGESGVCALTGEIGPLVRSMKFAPGFGAGFEWIDPNCAYRLSDKRLILRVGEEREVWRDTGPLALLRAGQWKSKDGKMAFERPAVMTQISEAISNGVLPAKHQLNLTVYAVRTDLKMKTFEWVRETLRLPFALLEKSSAAIAAQSAMEEADYVAYVLRRAIKIAYPRDGKGNKAAFATLIRDTEKLFWRELRPSYDEFLEALARLFDDSERDSARQTWRQQAAKTGWDAIRFALDDIDGNALALERQTAAYKNFRDGVSSLINPEKAEERKQKAKTRKGGAALLPTNV